METYTFSTLIAALKTDVKELAEIKLELLRLETVEKSSAAGSFLLYGLIIINLVFFALLFAFIALGFLLGEWIDNIAGGFVIVTLIYLLLLILLIVCRKPILTGFKNRFLKVLDPDLDDETKYEAKHSRKSAG
jgi:hypothetical protein